MYFKNPIDAFKNKILILIVNSQLYIARIVIYSAMLNAKEINDQFIFILNLNF